MGKIIASYLLKVHLHAPDDASDEDIERAEAGLSNDDVKDAVIGGLKGESDWDATVSLIERTDAD